MMSQELSADVCIVGGGIAGNYLADLLTGSGTSCIVVERYNSLETRPLQCAGIVSEKLLDLVQFPRSIILNRIKIADIYAPNLMNIRMKGRESPVVIDRIAFDTYFGNCAMDKGAVYCFNERYINHIIKQDNTVWIKTNRRIIKSKVIVGADGPRSKVALNCGVKNDFIPAAQVRAKLDYNSENTAMYFHPRWKELFGYIVPEGSGNICRIGLATKNRPSAALNKFLRLLNIKEEDIISKQGGLIPFGFPKKIAFNHTVLLGDSAAMVKATTGGGIVMLLSAAKILAPVINESFTKNDYSEHFFIKNYQNAIKHGYIGLSLKLHYFIRLLLTQLKEYDFKYFFKIYSNTTLGKDIERYADMDFPIMLAQKLIRNKYFVRFLLHLMFRNLNLIPQLIRGILF